MTIFCFGYLNMGKWQIYNTCAVIVNPLIIFFFIGVWHSMYLRVCIRICVVCVRACMSVLIVFFSICFAFKWLRVNQLDTFVGYYIIHWHAFPYALSIVAIVLFCLSGCIIWLCHRYNEQNWVLLKYSIIRKSNTDMRL